MFTLCDSSFQTDRFPEDGSPSPLYLASKAQDLETVTVLLDHAARPDLFGGALDNPLQVASRFGSLEIVKRLLKVGSDVNRKSGIFGTALYAACQWENLDVVNSLLEHHADPNIQGCGLSDTVLQLVCRSQWFATNVCYDIAKVLLHYGADPNLHGGLDGSALHATCVSGCEATVTLLLRQGVDLH